MNQQHEDNILAFSLIRQKLGDIGITMEGFRQRLEDRQFVYSVDAIYNWGKKGRGFPKSIKLIRAIIDIMVTNRLPHRRWSASQAIQFALLAGAPIKHLDSLADLFGFAPKEFELARAQLVLVSPSEFIELAIAEAKLQALPLTSIPEPSALPPGSLPLPYEAKALLWGREELLLEIAQGLKKGCRSVLSGMGGIGKTHVCSEVAHRYGQYFAGGVFWINAQEDTSIPLQIAACGGNQGMQLSAQFESFPEEKQVQLVINAWSKPIPRLIILDNLNNLSSPALTMLPQHGGCRVLVTSQVATWPTDFGFNMSEVKPFARPDSLKFLCRGRPDLRESMNDPYLDKLAEVMNDLPLALLLAGSFLEKYRDDERGTPEHYYKEINVLHPSFAIDAISHIGHSSLATTIKVSYEQLDASDTTDAVTQHILKSAACFASNQPIPMDLLLATYHGTSRDHAISKRVTQALQRAVELSLLIRGANRTVLIHPLIAQYLSSAEPIDEVETLVRKTMIAELNRFENDIESLHPIRMQLRYISEKALGGAINEEVGLLCSRFGWYLTLSGQIHEAQQWQEKGLDIHRSMYGLFHPETAESLCRLALVHQYKNDFVTAKDYMDEMLLIYDELYPLDSLKLSEALHNYGTLLMAYGDFNKAEETLQRALQIRHHRVRSDKLNSHGVDVDIARTLRSLGALMIRIGKYSAGYKYTNLSRIIYERNFTTPQMGIAQAYNNIGEIHYYRGFLSQARTCHERALDVRNHLFRIDDKDTNDVLHQDVAESLWNLGRVAHAEKQWKNAEMLFLRGIRINEEVVGPRQIETGYIIESYGCLLRDTDQYSKSKEMLETAYAIYEEANTQDKISCARTLYELAILYIRQEQFNEATLLLDKATRLIDPSIRRYHPVKGRILMSKGHISFVQEEFNMALRYLSEAYTHLSRTIPFHPDTAHVLIKLKEIS